MLDDLTSTDLVWLVPLFLIGFALLCVAILIAAVILVDVFELEQYIDDEGQRDPPKGAENFSCR